MNYPKRGSRPENSTSNDEKSDNRLTGMDIAVAAAATGVVAFTAWGISQLLRSSEPKPKHHEEMMISSSSSSRRVRHQNMNEYNDITNGQVILEGKRTNLGDGNYKWSRPVEGHFKLNTDASVRKQHGDKTGPATAGGVIRNHAGEWVVGFTSKLGECDSTQAELEAVRDGLRLACELEYGGLEVETDSEAAVTLIKKTDLKKNHYLSLHAKECRDLLKIIGSEISHVYKEGNECAHALAKAKMDPNKRMQMWKDIPNDHVRDVVESDRKQSCSPYYDLA